MRLLAMIGALALDQRDGARQRARSPARMPAARSEGLGARAAMDQ
jgi:hypothetical protein